MVRHFWRQGRKVNRIRIQRLMRIMGIEAVHPKPPHPQHRNDPFRFRNPAIDHANRVWATDITHLSMARGFLYLAAIMDWHRRKILSWHVSNTLDSDFCNQAIQEALGLYGKPEIFTTDQSAQFTGNGSTQILKDHEIAISKDGRGRCRNSIFVERLLWTIWFPAGARVRPGRT
jgi:putative transposase